MVRCAYLSRRCAPQLAQGPWEYGVLRHVDARPGIFRVNLDFCRSTRVLPGFGLVPSKFMAPDHTASKSEPGSVRGLS